MISISASSDKTDEFNLVVLLEHLVRKLWMLDYPAVQLRNQGLRVQLQGEDQIVERNIVIDGSLFAVTGNVHGVVVHLLIEVGDKKVF
jgi:hypothetical protein